MSCPLWAMGMPDPLPCATQPHWLHWLLTVCGSAVQGDARGCMVLLALWNAVLTCASKARPGTALVNYTVEPVSSCQLHRAKSWHTLVILLNAHELFGPSCSSAPARVNQPRSTTRSRNCIHHLANRIRD